MLLKVALNTIILTLIQYEAKAGRPFDRLLSDCYQSFCPFGLLLCVLFVAGHSIIRH